MAKQRNSLGIVVLPIINAPMTWEEYKSKYGIDLDSIFGITENNVVVNTSKLIALDAKEIIESGDSQFQYPKVFIPNWVSNTNGGVELAISAFSTDDGSVLIADGLRINKDRTVGFFQF